MLSQAIGYSQVIQTCTENTPFYQVNLQDDPAGTWVSAPPIVRAGSCCGSTKPDRCIEFSIQLHPDAIAINFVIAEGAEPTGAMFYQIDCGPPTAVGTPICIETSDRFNLTFCKPGANLNTYALQSIPGPGGPPDDTIRVGCQKSLISVGLDPATVSWTEITSGNGQYLDYLDCTNGCSEVTVSPQAGAPAFVDYVVCGEALAPACGGDGFFCDTVRAYFPDGLEVEVTPNPASFCEMDGGVNLVSSVTGGSGNYSYEWILDGANIPNSIDDESTFFASEEGSYELSIIDLDYPSCPGATTVVPVTMDLLPFANAGVDFPICADAELIPLDGVVENADDIQWSGGGGTFIPDRKSAATGYIPSANEISAGFVNLSLTASSEGACPPDEDGIRVNITQPMVVSMVAPEIVCFGQTTVIRTQVTGGSTPYTYSWNTGAKSPSIIAPPGDYTVTVTGASGACEAVGAVSVLEDPLLTIEASAATQITCDSLMQVSATSSGGTGNHQILWSTGQTSPTITVNPGNYSVQVTDEAGCVAQTNVNILSSNSDLSATIPTPAALCFNGQTTLTAQGLDGVAPYNYVWSSGQAGPQVTVGAGEYCAQVTDGAGCKFTACVDVQENDPIAVSVTQPEAVCSGERASVNLTTSGGQSPYSYTWSNGSVGAAVNLGAGTYTVTVSDNNVNDCQVLENITVAEAPAINTAFNTVNHVTCFNGSDGNVTVSVSGGYAPYEYEWSPRRSTSATLENLNAGNYAVVITDSLGCSVADTVSITEPELLTVSVTTSTDVTCNGRNDGAASVEADGGTMPYSYEWQPMGGVNPDATGLEPGEYAIEVTDIQGCTETDYLTISEPTPLTVSENTVVDVKCYGGATGRVVVDVLGGNGDYTFDWTGSASISRQASGLAAGNYTVTVTDGKGCTATFDATVDQSPELIALMIDSGNVSCFNGQDGFARGGASGGTAPYSYSWSHGVDGAEVDELAAGSYLLNVVDTLGCSAFRTVTLTQPTTAVGISTTGSGSILCSEGSNIGASGNGGEGPYSYLWGDGQSGASIFVDNPGIYPVTVTDSKGCSAYDVVEISASDTDLELQLSGEPDICFNASTTVEAIVFGGTPDYSYA